MTDIGTLGGDWSVGNAINSAGQIVGQAYLPGNVQAHAFLYSGGEMKDLGALGGFYSSALAVNSTATEIVGYATGGSGIPRAFIYRDGAMKDLNGLIPRGGWVLNTASGIDDTGQIVGYGLYRGEQHAFLLTPK